MVAHTPIMLPFLRPLRLPRPSTMRHFLRFSTSTQCHRPAASHSQPDQPRQDPNLLASRTASPSYPPPSMKSQPRPKISKASRRTNHPRLQRAYPTRQPTHHPTTLQKLIPSPITPLPESHSAPNLAYFVTRTRSNELPVYQTLKRGGNLKITQVRKIDGDVEVLRDELRQVLGLMGKGGGIGRGRVKGGREDCVVNPLTRQVVLKGHWKGEVVRFLRERRF